MSTTATASEILDFDALLAEASEQAGGLRDFGDDDFREPLRRFLNSAIEETPLVEHGAAQLRQEVVRLLVNRLLVQRDLVAHPEILDELVDDPVVITGLPRTGTTKLQRMMGADPGMQAARLWQILFPAPTPSADNDSRRQLAETFTTQLAQLEPDFMAAHSLVPDEPEEEVLMVQSTFDRLGVLNWMYEAPSYHTYLQDREQTPAYRYLSDLLKYLQWQDGGRQGRPWVLKAPGHTSNLPALFTTFPSATVVHCHRDPVTVLPSFCRLVELIRSTRGHQDRPRTIGSFLLDLLPGEIEKNIEQRAALGTDASIIDLQFSDIVANPVAAIDRIHRHRGEELDDVSITAMNAWSDTNPVGKHGAHTYSLERYGLTESSVRHAFRRYYDFFEVR